MKEYNFPDLFVERYRKFLKSSFYTDVDPSTKSEYWEYHSNQVKVDASNNKIKIIKANSGYYVPPDNNMTNFFVNKLYRLINNPFSVVKNFYRTIFFNNLKLFNYHDAFEKVFSHDPIADIVLSPSRINFKKISSTPGVLPNIKEVKIDYSRITKNRYKVNGHIIKAYYLFNIIHAYIDLTLPRNILEIGGGNGNLLSLLYASSDHSTIIDVDLPETLSHAIPFISDLFPEAKILMPHEVESQNFSQYDFIFLTPKQINLIKDKSIDLTINISSFQEMKSKQINDYFKLINRTSKYNSYFFTANRVEKFPTVFRNEDKTIEKVNHFFSYPWNSENKILIYEISRLSRLVNLDDGFIRLEQVK